ncbi:hypothetical protein pb186bvf_014766 [Paramecium bursaria]
MDQDKQKQHKKNEKLDKKRKKEKEQKKIKKLQKKAYELIKDDKKEEFLGIKLNRDKVIKSFKKFLKVYKDDFEDFFDLFTQLDEGSTIETGEIEDEQVKTRLQKLFRKLKLKNQGSEKQPKYKKKKNNASLNQFMRSIYDQVVHGIMPKQESSSSESESEDPRQTKQIKIQQDTNDDQKFDRQQVREKLLSGHEKKVHQPDSLEFAVEQMFSKVDNKRDSKLSQFLDNRVKVQETPKSNTDNSIYLGAKPAQKMSQEETMEYMRQYDEVYRSKTLLQLHQETMKQKSVDKLGNQDPKKRKDFNRETDLSYMPSAQQMIESMRQKGGLNSKFSQGHLQNSFI